MNTRIYSLLLTLCPPDLRQDFGDEMVQVFLEDLENHRRDAVFPELRVYGGDR